MGISQSITGVVLLALGTSLPELTIAFLAAKREAELHAQVARLERELDDRRPQTG